MADPLTYRYNNPGAVEYQPWMQKYGASVGPNGRYAQFHNADAGYGVMGKVLDTYQNKHGLNTVEGIIGRWAPSNVDQNSTGQYIKSVAQRVGVDPQQPLLPEHRQPLMQAMASYEAGRSAPPMGLGGPQPQSSPGAPPMDYNTSSQQPPQQMGLLGNIANRMNAPLTQQGLGLLLAGIQGSDLNAGMTAGSQRANAASQNLLQQMEADRIRQQQELANGISSNKTLMQALPPEVMAGLNQMEPQARAKMLGEILSRRQDIKMLGDVETQKASIDLNKQIELARQQRQMSLDMMDQVEKRMSPQEGRPQGLPGNARRAQDGKFYVPDPNRPGKYMMWQE